MSVSTLTQTSGCNTFRFLYLDKTHDAANYETLAGSILEYVPLGDFFNLAVLNDAGREIGSGQYYHGSSDVFIELIEEYDGARGTAQALNAWYASQLYEAETEETIYPDVVSAQTALDRGETVRIQMTPFAMSADLIRVAQDLQDEKRLQQLIGNDLHEAFRLENPHTKLFSEMPTNAKLAFDKVANALNVKLGLCPADTIVYILVADITDMYTLAAKTELWGKMMNACNEGDNFTIYLIQGGKEVGQGWYKLCQNWYVEVIAEYNQAQGLGTFESEVKKADPADYGA